MTKLNNKQLKKIYDYGGTLSPKDWGDMIDSLRPDYLEEAPIVETTYEDARDLYYKGQMIPGVMYEFTYYKPNFYADDLEISLLLHVDRLGKLKVFGKYIINEVSVRPFYADFKFDALYIAPDLDTGGKINITYGTASLPNYEIRTDLSLSELGFEFIEDNWNGRILIPNVFTWYNDHETCYYIISRNGTHILAHEYDDFIEINVVEEQEVGYIHPAIYNIHYGEEYYHNMDVKYNEITYDKCFHSTFVDTFYNIAYCNIYGSSIDDYFYWDTIPPGNISGIIIDSNLTNISDSNIYMNNVRMINNIDLNEIYNSLGA